MMIGNYTKGLFAFVCILPLSNAMRDTYVTITSSSCSKGYLSLHDASCGLGEPCQLGDSISLSGSYSPKYQLPTTLKVCGKLQASTSSAGTCKLIDVCESLFDCDQEAEKDGYLTKNTEVDFEVEDVLIPGSGKYFGKSTTAQFIITATANGVTYDQCTIYTRIEGTDYSGEMYATGAAAVLVIFAGIYYGKKRRLCGAKREDPLLETEDAVYVQEIFARDNSLYAGPEGGVSA